LIGSLIGRGLKSGTGPPIATRSITAMGTRRRLARTFWRIINPITRGVAGLAPWWVLLETTGDVVAHERRVGPRERLWERGGAHHL